jgi:hypothetical protein
MRNIPRGMDYSDMTFLLWEGSAVF